MASDTNDYDGLVSRLGSSNLFSVRMRLYQKLSIIDQHNLDPESAGNLLSHVVSDLTYLSSQSNSSTSEWETLVKLTCCSFNSLKDISSEKFGKILSSIQSFKGDSKEMAILMARLCLIFIGKQCSITVGMKRHILEVAVKAESLGFDSNNVPDTVFKEYLSMTNSLAHDNENLRHTIAGVVKSLKELVKSFSREQKIHLLKNLSNESFGSFARNISRSPTMYTVLRDILISFLYSLGDVLHSATSVNVILGWATCLAKSLIHDAALEFYNVWIALIDNFSESKNLIISSRHRKLILSGFGPTLTNNKLRTPDLIIAKVRAWWYFVTKISHADSEFFLNADNFNQVLAPLISLISGESLHYDAKSVQSIKFIPDKYATSELNKQISAANMNSRNDLIALLCNIIFEIMMQICGSNTYSKLDLWLQTKHPLLHKSESEVPKLSRSTVFELSGINTASSFSAAIAFLLAECVKFYNNSPNNVKESGKLDFALARIFVCLVFWLASSDECSQNSGIVHWKELAGVLDSCSGMHIKPAVLAGMHATFVSEWPTNADLNCEGASSEDYLFSLLTRFSKVTSESASMAKSSLSVDPSPEVNSLELAFMKLLAVIRKLSASSSFEKTNWKLLDSTCSILTRQETKPPSYVVYCWIHNWQRLAELVEGWFSNNQNVIDISTFTSFLAMPFKFLRLCPPANNANCSQIVQQNENNRLSLCQCSSCRRLLEEEFLAHLAAKWRHLFEAFCNAPDTDTPRLSSGSGSINKLCTKLLKSLKPKNDSPTILSLPFLTFAALCLESMCEKALSTSSTTATRRTSRISSLTSHSEANSNFLRCVSGTCHETASALGAIVTLLGSLRQQCKKSGSTKNVPVGWSTVTAVKTFVHCFESMTSSGENGIAGFNGVASTLVPAIIDLLLSAVRIVDASESSILCIASPESDLTMETVCTCVIEGTKQILDKLSKFSDVKNAMLSDSSKGSKENLSKTFSDLIGHFKISKHNELKQLAKEMTKDIWQHNKDKHSLSSEVIQACALIADSQPSQSQSDVSTRTRKRASIAVKPNEEKTPKKGAATSTTFGSLLTSPTKARSQTPSTQRSPLFSTSKRPNTVSTTGRGTPGGLRKSSSISGKRSAPIDLEQSCDFVVVEASQDVFESAKKRRTKATEHQIEVMTEKKSDIPQMFNTLDQESQQSMSNHSNLKTISKSSAEANKESDLSSSVSDKSSHKKKKIVPVRTLRPRVNLVGNNFSKDEKESENKTGDENIASEQKDVETVQASENTSTDLTPLNDVDMNAKNDENSEIEKNSESVLHLDSTIADSVISSAVEVDDAEMMLVAEEIEAAHSSDGRTSPDVIESSVEFVAESVDVLADESVKPEILAISADPQPEVEVATPIKAKAEDIVVPSSQSPPLQSTSETTGLSELSGNCNISPMQQSTLAMLKVDRGTPSSPGILKRPNSTLCSGSGMIVDTPSPARKPRHVSFSAKTYVKEISPINAPSSHGQESIFMSWRSSRRAERDQQQTTPVVPITYSDSSTNKSETGSSNANADFNEKNPVYPALMNCSRPFGEILPQIAPGQHGLLAVLRAQGVRTIGDLAKLTYSEVRKLPIRTPQVEVLRSALSDYEKKTDLQKESKSRMAKLFGSRCSTGSISHEPTGVSSATSEDTKAEVPQITVTAEDVSTKSVETSKSNTEIQTNPSLRSAKVDLFSCETEDFNFVPRSKKMPIETTEIACQTDDYTLAISTLISSSVNAASPEYCTENGLLMSQLAKWCMQTVQPGK